MKQSVEKILVVEDESAIREMLVYFLEKEAYQVLEAETAQQAKQLLKYHHPLLIIMDWKLPDQSGIQLVKQFKKMPGVKEIPIIMITSMSEESHKLQGFSEGVDDYMTKPFSPKELLARIGAVLKRHALVESDDLMRWGDLLLDRRSHQLSCDGENIPLTRQAFQLLHYFMTHTDRVYTRTELLDRVWGQDKIVNERTVDAQIKRLRQSLEPYGHKDLIQTVRGAGYLCKSKQS